MTKVPIRLPTLKERDLHTQIREQGFERGVTYTLGRVIGEHGEDRQHVRELTQLVDQCISQLNSLVMVNTHMRDTITAMKRAQRQSEDLDNR